MNTPSGRPSRHLVGFLAAAAAAVMGLTGLSGIAQAADTGNIDPHHTGSITVHKFSQPDAGTDRASDGTEVDTTGLAPLPGVTFSVAPINGLDLTSNADWAKVSGLTENNGTVSDTGKKTYTLGAAKSGTTAADGTAAFTDLPMGVYLVRETDPGQNPITDAAAPFFVTIPLPHDTKGWIYDVHVYPKNSVTAIDKTVDDSAAQGLGSTVTWTITARIPALPAGKALSTFAVSDTLDQRLSATQTTVTGPVAVAEGTDYTLSTQGKTLTVTFLDAGLKKLQSHANADVTITVTTTVDSIGDGTIPNTATVSINDLTRQTTAVTTLWGALKIVKQTPQSDGAAPLSGASFQVFASEADAEALRNPVAVGSQTTFTTGDSGTVGIDGLNVGQGGTRDYWVVETQAPSGFILDQTPHQVTLTTGSVSSATSVSIANTRQKGPHLPITGANGRLLLTLGGAALVALAVGIALVASRQRKRH